MAIVEFSVEIRFDPDAAPDQRGGIAQGAEKMVDELAYFKGQHGDDVLGSAAEALRTILALVERRAENESDRLIEARTGPRIRR